MKTTVKRVIIILLVVLLLMGIKQFGPQLRFAFDLYTGRYDAAELIYDPSMASEDNDRWKSFDKMICTYMDRMLDRYYQGKLSYEDAMSVFEAMDEHQSFHPYAVERIQLVNEMEAARIDLGHADTYYSNGDYAQAIPLYRRSFIADASAVSRLALAEEEFRKTVLQEAESAMDEQHYDIAEQTLLDGQAVLESEDDDLSAALKDVRHLQKEQANNAILTEAMRLLREDGPEATIGYMADMRKQSPDAYEIEYMEQMILHECEEEYCSKALSLKEAGQPKNASSLLEEGLAWIDSPKMKALLAEIRGSIVYVLGDMPVLRDETCSLRTGEASTIERDLVLTDSLSNEYSHSFYADIGSVSFALQGDFAVFAGTVAFPKGEKADIYRQSATLQVFGDGTLIGEFTSADMAAEPVPFYFSVDDVQELTLRWISDGANGWKDWGRFATIFDGRLLYDTKAEAAAQ